MKNTYRILFSFIFILVVHFPSFSQTVQDNSSEHEITVFVIPEVSAVNWENPAILFKSTMKCYFNAALKKNYYVIGHFITRISSPLLDSTIYVGMNGAVQTEKVESVLKHRVGFGALGMTMKGRMEPFNHIKKGLALYGKRNRVAYLKFKVDENAIKRVIQFLNYYQTKNKLGFAPCEHYNGALWPGYENEGSGCSAFGMTILDIANLLPEFAKSDWMVNVNVPMNIIGGEFNQNKKIKLKTILKTKSWYNGDGKEGIDFVNYKVFDPGKVFNWINNKRQQNDSDFIPDDENIYHGVIFNEKYISPDLSTPVIKQRTDTTFFARYFYKFLRNKYEVK